MIVQQCSSSLAFSIFAYFLIIFADGTTSMDGSWQEPAGNRQHVPGDFDMRMFDNNYSTSDEYNNRVLQTEGFDLGKMYQMPPPDIFYCDDSADFIFRFELSDYIQNDVVEVEMMLPAEDGKSCNGEFITGNPYLSPGLVFDKTPIGDGTGIRQIAVALEGDADLVPSSPIYFPTPEGSDTLPYVNFCLRLKLYSPGKEYLVNFRDIEFFLFLRLENVGFDNAYGNADQIAVFDNNRKDRALISSSTTTTITTRRRRLIRCFDGFEIVFTVGQNDDGTPPTISPAPSAPTVSPMPTPVNGFVTNPTNPITLGGKNYKNATASYGVIGFLCDDELKPLKTVSIPNTIVETEQESVELVPKQPGDMVRVCVVPDDDAATDGLYLRYIDAFSFFKDGDDSVRQVAIEPTAQAASDGLTEVHCEGGSSICWFDTMLVGSFYRESGAIVGTGKATLQFGNSSANRRQLDEEEQPAPSGEGVGRISLAFVTLTKEDAEKYLTAGIDDSTTGSSLTDREKTIILVAILVFFLTLLVGISGAIIRLHYFHEPKKLYQYFQQRKPKNTKLRKQALKKKQSQSTSAVSLQQTTGADDSSNSDDVENQPSLAPTAKSTRSKSTSTSEKRYSKRTLKTRVDWCGDV